MDKALAIQKEVMKILATDEVYLCGGAVRDLVMGNEPKDYDFTTAMLPDDIELMCLRRGRHPYKVGKAFGTIGFKCPLRISDGNGDIVATNFEYVEVTTFRSEVYTNKSRKPEVKFVPTLDEDLKRRDFTFNAMVLKPDGKIYDPFGGRLDLHAGLIKTVGMPKDRIQEDPLRMLRAARFAARYNFKIDPNFIGKARQLADRIYDVSVERWVQELDKLFTSEYWPVGAEALMNMRILERILPEIVEFNDNGMRFEDPDIAWKNILHDIHDNPKTAKYINTGICHRMKFSKKRTDIILDNNKEKKVQ